jgi:hypothetical protein
MVRRTPTPVFLPHIENIFRGVKLYTQADRQTLGATWWSVAEGACLRYKVGLLVD